MFLLMKRLNQKIKPIRSNQLIFTENENWLCLFISHRGYDRIITFKAFVLHRSTEMNFSLEHIALFCLLTVVPVSLPIGTNVYKDYIQKDPLPKATELL